MEIPLHERKPFAMNQIGVLVLLKSAFLLAFQHPKPQQPPPVLSSAHPDNRNDA